MSAIFGVVGAVSSRELETMGERLRHRGAVVTCEEVAPGVYLGVNDAEPRELYHRNGVAAVVDLSSIADPGEEIAVVDSLAGGRGLPLEQWSRPFAAAAWDERTRSLLLARDFVGQKPLHFCALSGGVVAFATEYKALLALERLPAEPDLDAIQYLQCHKTTPAGRTPLKDVGVVAPGTVTRLDADGHLLGREEATPLRVDVRAGTEAAIRDELARRCIEAVRPLVADAPRVAISLSGGIDSLSVAFVARRCAPEVELTGYTAGHGTDDAEMRTAALAMERLGGRHEPVIVTSERLHELLPEAIWYFESPIGRTETIQMLEIGRVARTQGFDWLLSGLGSDTLFAGMPKHRLLWLSQKLPPLRRDLYEFYELTQSGLGPRRPAARLMDAIYFRGAVPPVPRVDGAAWAPEPTRFPPVDPEFLNHVMAENGHEKRSRSLMRLERPLQAHGIDLVSPFFDRGLMDYAYTIPSRLKIRRGVDKYILRQAMRSIVSPELLKVPKGIARIRQDRSFADVLQKLAAHYLGDGELERRSWFRREDISAVLGKLNRRRYHPEAAMRLWTAIGTEIWARLYLDRRGEKPSLT